MESILENIPATFFEIDVENEPVHGYDNQRCLCWNRYVRSDEEINGKLQRKCYVEQSCCSEVSCRLEVRVG
jgi:hypothetical protein